MPAGGGWGGWRRWYRQYGLQVALVAPLALYTLCFTLVPVLRAIWLGFSDPGGGLTLAHYRAIVGHGQFKQAVANTVVLTAMGLALELAVGLALAWCLTCSFRLRGLVRSLLLVPMGVPTLVSAVNMMYIFDTNGYLNELLWRLGLIHSPVDWAAGGFRTLFMVVLADMWKVTPMVVLILLAGLEGIPGDVYEAAAVDGATGWQAFLHVTLPLLQPAITTALVLRGIDAFRIFELPLVLAGRQTPVLATYAFTEYYQYHNPHTAGAAATLLLAVILAFAAGYLRLAREADAT